MREFYSKGRGLPRLVATPAPKGASDFDPKTASLKRCPDTNHGAPEAARLQNKIKAGVLL
jgi:hypothetical protein